MRGLNEQVRRAWPRRETTPSMRLHLASWRSALMTWGRTKRAVRQIPLKLGREQHQFTVQRGLGVNAGFLWHGLVLIAIAQDSLQIRGAGQAHGVAGTRPVGVERAMATTGNRAVGPMATGQNTELIPDVLVVIVQAHGVRSRG